MGHVGSVACDLSAWPTKPSASSPSSLNSDDMRCLSLAVVEAWGGGVVRDHNDVAKG
jgi:hypothetical protein